VFGLGYFLALGMIIGSEKKSEGGFYILS